MIKNKITMTHHSYKLKGEDIRNIKDKHFMK
jgi:hypothetical protein